MPSNARPAPVCVLIRLWRVLARVLVVTLRVVFVGLAMGVAPPSLVKVLPEEDSIVQVEEEEAL